MKLWDLSPTVGLFQTTAAKVVIPCMKLPPLGRVDICSFSSCSSQGDLINNLGRLLFYNDFLGFCHFCNPDVKVQLISLLVCNVTVCGLLFSFLFWLQRGPRPSVERERG